MNRFGAPLVHWQKKTANDDGARHLAWAYITRAGQPTGMGSQSGARQALPWSHDARRMRHRSRVAGEHGGALREHRDDGAPGARTGSCVEAMARLPITVAGPWHTRSRSSASHVHEVLLPNAMLLRAN
jgi:hypothetical protein